jgi:hypothetical protein
MDEENNLKLLIFLRQTTLMPKEVGVTILAGVTNSKVRLFYFVVIVHAVFSPLKRRPWIGIFKSSALLL